MVVNSNLASALRRFAMLDLCISMLTDLSLLRPPWLLGHGHVGLVIAGPQELTSGHLFQEGGLLWRAGQLDAPPLWQGPEPHAPAGHCTHKHTRQAHNQPNQQSCTHLLRPQFLDLLVYRSTNRITLLPRYTQQPRYNAVFGVHRMPQPCRVMSDTWFSLYYRPRIGSVWKIVNFFKFAWPKQRNVSR